MSQLCRVVSEAKYNARDRRRNKPQPWIVLKFMVGFTLGLLIYAAYVYIGRFCVESIQRERFTKRGTAIGLLVVFCILWLWAMWAYIKIIITSPGYARDYVSKTPQPLIPHRVSQSNAIHVPLAEEEPTVSGPPYEQQSTAPLADPEKATTSNSDPNRPSRPPPLSQGSQPYVPPAYVGGQATTPVLHPAHRYCTRDGFVKPYRAHHCRPCGTCVLRYDHHCPWIGQCVGARNHKFFINFNFAAFIFTAYTFATLLAFNIQAINSVDGDIDAQSIVIIALSALFTIFTGSLLISHVYMVWKGQSTVESLEIKDLKERIKYRAFNEQQEGDRGCIARPDSRALKEYTKEWGSPDREGYIWWMGSHKKAWVDVMGNYTPGWFLPIGRPLGDGLTYPVNPRFDGEGRRRKKSDWPEELRGGGS